MGFSYLGGRRLDVGWDDVGSISCGCVYRRFRVGGLTEQRSHERQVRCNRVPRRGCDCLYCHCSNSLSAIWNKPRRCAGNCPCHAFAVADLQAWANTVANRQSVASTLADR